MQTPISFVLDLILDYELPPDAQKRCRKYVRELEANLVPGATIQPRINHVPAIRAIADQAPSTLALMAKHAANPNTADPPVQAVDAPIITSPAAAMALAARQSAINAAVSGKPEAGRTSPRKF
jgi:hypothetical protein